MKAARVVKPGQITPSTAHELAQVFGTSPEFWMNLETNYRLHLAQKGRG